MLPETRLLEAVIILAEELHFTRAAERLRIDQSTLSRRITELEEKVGVLLFERNHQVVELTEAGRQYVQGVRDALLQIERAALNAVAASRGADAVLNLGRSSYIDPFLVTAPLSMRLALYPG